MSRPKAIVEILREHGPLRFGQLREKSKLERTQVIRALYALITRGDVIRSGTYHNYVYRLPGTSKAAAKAVQFWGIK